MLYKCLYFACLFGFALFKGFVYSGDLVKENEMGWGGRPHELGKTEIHTGILPGGVEGGDMKESDHLEDTGTDGFLQ